MLENNYTGNEAIACTILDSFSNPFFSSRCHFVTRNSSICCKHYLHFIQQRIVKKELPKDSSMQNCFMLSIVCSNVDH